jgi:hypothetical protein
MHGTTKLLGVLLTIGVGGSAFAVQFSFKGDLNNRANVYTNQARLFAASESIGTLATPGEVLSPQPIPETWAEVKYRLQAEITSDDKVVRGVYAMEIGSVRFGFDIRPIAPPPGSPPAPGSTGKNAGGGYSGDGVNVETRFAYIDVGIPTPEPRNFRATFGLQPVSVNRFLWQETAMGINLKGDVGPAGLTLAWYRGIEFFNSTISDPTFGDADSLLARVGVEPDKQTKAGIFALYQRRESNVPLSATNRPAHLLKLFGPVDYDLVNLGIDGALTFGPLLVNADFIYQTGNTSITRGTPLAKETLNVGGFFAHVDLGVNLGAARVMYTGWYASGDSVPGDNRMTNFVATDLDVTDSIVLMEGGYNDDNYLTEAPYFLDKGAVFNKLGVDFKATENFTVGAAVLYIMTAQDLILGDGSTSRSLGTEIDAYIGYRLNANLELGLNAGYLFAGNGMDFFELAGANKNGSADANPFRSTARARFTF